MKFNNRDNKIYQTEDGPIWHSRSTALVIILFFYYDSKYLTLIEKRGKDMDEPGKWCVPCGYLDWDEDAQEAMRREIFEETSLDILEFKDVLYEDPHTKPFYFKTYPEENRQNVTACYTKAYHIISKKDKNKIRDLQEFSNSEVSKIELVGLDLLKNYDFAFNHNERIIMAWEHLKQQLI